MSRGPEGGRLATTKQMKTMPVFHQAPSQPAQGPLTSVAPFWGLCCSERVKRNDTVKYLPLVSVAWCRVMYQRLLVDLLSHAINKQTSEGTCSLFALFASCLPPALCAGLNNTPSALNTTITKLSTTNAAAGLPVTRQQQKNNCLYLRSICMWWGIGIYSTNVI